jgi:hypothetical protein
MGGCEAGALLLAFAWAILSAIAGNKGNNSREYDYDYDFDDFDDCGD